MKLHELPSWARLLLAGAGVCLALAIAATRPLVTGVAAQQAPDVVETVAGGGSLPSVGVVNGIAAVPGEATYYFLASSMGRLFVRPPSGAAAPVAGNGFRGFGGDGGSALDASFDLAVAVGDVTVDPLDPSRVYVADFYNHRVRLVDTTAGTIDTVVGSGECGVPVAGAPLAAPLCFPQSVAVDLDGSIYILSYNEIWRVRNGLAEPIAVSGTTRPWGDASFALGRLQIDPARRRLYIGHGQVAVMNLDDGTIAPFLAPEVGPFFTALAVDPATGDVYYMDGTYNQPLVRRRGFGATASDLVAGGGTLLAPFAPGTPADTVAFSGVFALGVRSGDLLVADGVGHIHAVDPAGAIVSVEGNGAYSHCGDGGPAIEACLHVPTSLVVSGDGSMVIADGENDILRRVDAAGVITGGTRGLFGPGAHLTAGDAGAIFVSSNAVHQVFQWLPSTDTAVSVAGSGCATGAGCPLGDGGPAADASFNRPRGLARDATGALFVADSGNHRIRRLAGDVVTTVGGDGTPQGQPGDGLSASATSFDTPVALAFDADGSLLVVEHATLRPGRSRIRRIAAGADGVITGSADEIVSTVAGTLGTGVPGDTDHVPAPSVSLTELTGIAVDPDFVYVADSANRRIRAIDRSDLTITTRVGGGTHPGDDGAPLDTALATRDFRGEADFTLADLVRADVGAASYLYFVDRGNDRIRRVALGPAVGGGNQPPTVSANSPVVAAAASPDGAQVTLVASGSDPDGDPLTFTWRFGAEAAQGDLASFQFPIGTSTATVTAEDGRGGSAQALVTVIVRGVVITDGAGPVLVPATYDGFTIKRGGFAPGVWLDLAGPSATYTASLNIRTDQVPAPPAGRQFGSPPYIYDLAVAPAPAGALSLCLDTAGMTFADAPNARLFHHTGAGWTDITTSGGAGVQICGTPASAGSFAIFTPTTPGSGAEAVAGNGAAVPYIVNPDGSLDVPDGGLAAHTPLLAALGTAIDRARNVVYVTDYNRIRRVDLATGLISTVAGDGAWPAIEFDAGAGVVRLVDPDDTRIAGATRLALDTQGRLYVAEPSGCRVLRYDPQDSSLVRVAGDGSCRSAGDGLPAPQGSVLAPSAVAFDAGGHLFVADAGSRLVRRVDAITGLLSTVAGNGTDTFAPDQPGTNTGLTPVDLAFGPNGDLYIAQGNALLLRVETGGDGAITGAANEIVRLVNTCALASCVARPFDGDGWPASAATFGALHSVAAESSGALLVGDGNRVRRIQPGADGVASGEVSTAAGYDLSIGEPPTGLFYYLNGEAYALSSAAVQPVALAPDPAGGFLWVDSARSLVRRTAEATPAFARADLAISATSSATDVSQGQEITYTVRVANLGPSLATGATVTMPVSAGMTAVTAVNTTAPGQFCVIPVFLSGSITCGLQVLAPGQEAVLSIRVRADAAGVLPAHVEVGALTEDPQPANNAVDLEVQVHPSADLAASIAAPAAGTVVDLGQSIATSVVLSNLGPSAAPVARLRFELPPGLVFESASMPGGVCDMASGVLVCDADQLPAGASRTAALSLRAAAMGPIAGTFTASGANFDPDPSNNEARLSVSGRFLLTESITTSDSIRGSDLVLTETIAVAETIKRSDLELIETIRVSDERPAPDGYLLSNPIGDEVTVNGSSATVRFYASNATANTPVTSSTLTATLPAVLSVVDSLLDSRCARAGQALTCVLPHLPQPPDAATIVIPVLVASDAAAFDQVVELTVPAYLSTPLDANTANDTAVGHVTVIGPRSPDLSIAFGDPPGLPAGNGDPVSMSLSVSNLGQGPTTGAAVVTVTAPAGFVISAVDPLGPVCHAAGATLTCSFAGVMPPQAVATVSLVVRVPDDYAGPGETRTPLVAAEVATPHDSDATDNSASQGFSVEGPIGILIPEGDNVPVTLVHPRGGAVPIDLLFARVTTSGHGLAIPMSAFPPVPAGVTLASAVFDVVITAAYTPPIEACFSGLFTTSTVLLHHEGGAWQLVPATSRTVVNGVATRVCGLVSSFSPLAAAEPANRPPAANAGAAQIVEATSPDGARVTVTGSAVDPDEGDVLAFEWRQGATVLGSGTTLVLTLPLGDHELTLTATDRAGASDTATTRVIVRDTTAPVVTPPPGLRVPALAWTGTRVSAWPALAAWLEAASASDAVDPAPGALVATLGGIAITPATVFPVGTTRVSFRFADASGNIGTAIAEVTVAVGQPRIAARVAASGAAAGTRMFVDLEFANTGDGLARQAVAILGAFTSGGRGLTRVLSPLGLVGLGDLLPGQTRTIRVALDVPASAREVTLVEAGAYGNALGEVHVFADRQRLAR